MRTCPTCSYPTDRDSDALVQARIATRPDAGPAQARHIARLEQELATAKGLPTDSEICHSCGSAVALVWAAKDQDWLTVVGHPGGLLCPKCFAEKAWQHHGISLAFLAVPLEDGWSTEWYRLEAWIAAKCTIAGCWRSLACEPCDRCNP